MQSKNSNYTLVLERWSYKKNKIYKTNFIQENSLTWKIIHNIVKEYKKL